MRLFEHEPHPRVYERQETGPARVADHLDSMNGRLAVGVTKAVGTMWAAYAFTLLALISLPAALASGNPIVIVSWVAQTLLQLVLLPVIMVGQTVAAKAADARSEQTFQDAEAILHEVTEIHRHLGAQDLVLRAVAKDRARP